MQKLCLYWSTFSYLHIINVWAASSDGSSDYCLNILANNYFNNFNIKPSSLNGKLISTFTKTTTEQDHNTAILTSPYTVWTVFPSLQCTCTVGMLKSDTHIYKIWQKVILNLVLSPLNQCKLLSDPSTYMARWNTDWQRHSVFTHLPLHISIKDVTLGNVHSVPGHCQL